MGTSASGLSKKDHRSTFAKELDFTKFQSLDQVTAYLSDSKLASCQLIFGIDFSSANNVRGGVTFGRRGLHDIDPMKETANPYQVVIHTLSMGLGRKLIAEETLVHAFGFGTDRTKDSSVFSFQIDDCPCLGYESVLQRYQAVTRTVTNDATSSFAPIIRKSRDIVADSGEFTLLVIISPCDTGFVDSGDPETPQEAAAVDAIVEASKLPLSILIVGVGDGPFTRTETMLSKLPDRSWNSIRFIRLPPSTLRTSGVEVAVQTKQRAAFAAMALEPLGRQLQVAGKADMLRRVVLDGVASQVSWNPPDAPVLSPGADRSMAPATTFLGGGVGGGGGGGRIPPPPALADVPPPPPAGPPPPGPSSGVAVTCPTCTFMNPAGSLQCSICMATIGSPAPPAPVGGDAPPVVTLDDPDAPRAELGQPVLRRHDSGAEARRALAEAEEARRLGSVAEAARLAAVEKLKQLERSVSEERSGREEQVRQAQAAAEKARKAEEQAARQAAISAEAAKRAEEAVKREASAKARAEKAAREKAAAEAELKKTRKQHEEEARKRADEAKRKEVAERKVQELERKLEDAMVCPICMEDPKNAALQCGHRFCWGCASPEGGWVDCPMCRVKITARIRLYD